MASLHAQFEQLTHPDSLRSAATINEFKNKHKFKRIACFILILHFLQEYQAK
jgi:hypothetical protein